MLDKTTLQRDEMIMKGDYSNDITSVVIPAKVKVICEGALGSCKYLSKVTFEKGSQLEIIEFGAFGGERLQTITIPRSVREIYAYMGGFEAVTFEPQSQLEVIGKWVFRRPFIPGEVMKLKEICIPRTVMEIGDKAFDGCKATVSFESGGCLERLGERAFHNCSFKNKTLQLPSTLTHIEEDAFSYCHIDVLDLSKATNLKAIPKNAFRDCHLKKVIMPLNGCVETIGEGAFYGNDFTSFSFVGVKRIEKDAFMSCMLKKAVLPLDCKLEQTACYDKFFEKTCEIDRKDLSASTAKAEPSENGILNFLGKIKSLFSSK